MLRASKASNIAQGPNYVADRGTVRVFDGERELTMLHPEKRTYASGGQVMTEAAIDAGVRGDLYVALGEPLGGDAWAVRVHVKPFVRWIWLGALLMALGGFVAATDRRFRRVGGHRMTRPRIPLRLARRRLRRCSRCCSRPACWLRAATPIAKRSPSPLIDKPAPHSRCRCCTNPTARSRSPTCSGAPYLLNVWGSWCPACRDEHPVLTRFAETKRVRVVGFNWKDDRDDALRWLEQFGNPYWLVITDVEGKSAIDWGIYGAPETFLVDAQRHRSAGSTSARSPMR